MTIPAAYPRGKQCHQKEYEALGTNKTARADEIPFPKGYATTSRRQLGPAAQVIYCRRQQSVAVVKDADVSPNRQPRQAVRLPGPWSHHRES
jgi:hypothetical protein